ncbi:MAG: DUF4147 domain-containing protein [Candidatus Paceibacterota bacterium]|jgi:glycerate-2-kinase
MKIKNYDKLASSASRKAALEILEAGLEVIDTKHVIERSVRTAGDDVFVLDRKIEMGQKGLYFVGVGKCATDSAIALEKILGDRLVGGILVDVCAPSNLLEKIRCLEGTHPMPSEKNINAAREITDYLKNLGEGATVIMVISGGGSTLLCYPEGEIDHKKEAEIVKGLFAAGATIQELNTIRKHLSLARGGFLAKYAYPAKVVSLIFSDVPGNDAGFISSGPTILDTTTVEDAYAVLKKYNISFDDGKTCNLIETPKESKYFDNVENILVVSNDIALAAMAVRARELGFSAEIKNAKMVGEARDIGEKIILDLHGASSQTVFLYGGETTVSIKGSGIGGRNQELALSALKDIKNDEVLVASSSDGRDNGDYAGAIVDIKIVGEAENLGLVPDDYLKNNDSTTFFKKIGDSLIETGATGSNVADFVIVMKE